MQVAELVAHVASVTASTTTSTSLAAAGRGPEAAAEVHSTTEDQAQHDEVRRPCRGAWTHTAQARRGGGWRACGNATGALHLEGHESSAYGMKAPHMACIRVCPGM